MTDQHEGHGMEQESRRNRAGRDYRTAYPIQSPSPSSVTTQILIYSIEFALFVRLKLYFIFLKFIFISL